MKPGDGRAGLLLRPDAYYAETPDGVYVLTHEGESAFSGRGVYHLIDRLAPDLNPAEVETDPAPKNFAQLAAMVG